MNSNVNSNKNNQNNFVRRGPHNNRRNFDEMDEDNLNFGNEVSNNQPNKKNNLLNNEIQPTNINPINNYNSLKQNTNSHHYNNSYDDLEKEEKKEAGKNTAHLAGRAAARYFGGAAGGKVYDSASKTKPVQALEKGVGDTIAKTPGVGELNKKINDTGAVDIANKALDLTDGKGLNKKSPGSNTPSNLKSSLNKSSDNIDVPDSLKNKNISPIRRNTIGSNNDSKNEDTKDDNNTPNDIQNDDGSNESKFAGNGLLKFIIPILLLGVPILIILIVVLSLLSPIISGYSFFYSLFHNNQEDASYYYTTSKVETASREAEIAFNNAIVGSSDGSVKGIVKEYQEQYNVKIDPYLLSAIILYRYTEGGSDNAYTDGKEQIETVANLMLIGEEGSYTTDNNVGGQVYSKLIQSDFLTNYYSSLLKKNDTETKQALVDEIYDYAANAKDLLDIKEESVTSTGAAGGVVSSSIRVHLQNCEKYSTSTYYRFKQVNNLSVYNNPLVNAGTSYPDYMDLRNYIKGVVTMEIGVSSSYKEAMKAQAIAALTFVIHDSKSGFNLKSGDMYYPNGTCRQAACYPEYGCSRKQVSGGIWTFYPGTNTATKVQGPLSSTNNAILDEVLDDVFGKIMVNKGVTPSSFKGSSDLVQIYYMNTVALCSRNPYAGKCMAQISAQNDAKNGMKYDAILRKYYGSISYDIINISEGLYTDDENFANANYSGNVVYYNQGNYSDKTFCGVSSKTIQHSGCGVTAAAIVASSLTGNKKYDPVYMSNLARTGTDCGAGLSGTQTSFFPYMAEKLNLKMEKASKNETSKVVTALKSGKSLVIAHMGPGHFTKGGHFIVLAAINDKGEALVYDPGHRANTEKWFSLNKIIADEAKSGFYIYSLK